MNENVENEIKKNKEIARQAKLEDRLKKIQTKWFKKYWPEVTKCGFPCNELERARRLVKISLYKEAECLIKQHEKLLQEESVLDKKAKVPFEEMYERDVRTKLEDVRQQLGLCPGDKEENAEDVPVCQCDRPCIRWRPGLITSKLDRFKMRQKRKAWIPPEDYACYDSETSTVGWGCFDEPLERCLGFKFYPKPHQMKVLSYPNGSLPLDPNTLM